jgi:hypothetical protein
LSSHPIRSPARKHVLKARRRQIDTIIIFKEYGRRKYTYKNIIIESTNINVKAKLLLSISK